MSRHRFQPSSPRQDSRHESTDRPRLAAEPRNATRRRRRIIGNGRRLLLAGVAGALVAGGAATLGIAAASQRHAPQPTASQAGTIGPARTAAGADDAGHAKPGSAPASAGSARPVSGLARATPVSIDIPAIDVRARLRIVGLNPNGTIQVPPLFAEPSEAAWFNRSPTPGEVGSSVIEGHIDTYKGPSVFFQLGALRPGDIVDITLADQTVAVFRVTGVRQYPKNDFPTLPVYEDTSYPSLRLITCGGAFDSTTRQYLSSTVVFATLVAHHRAGRR